MNSVQIDHFVKISALKVRTLQIQIFKTLTDLKIQPYFHWHNEIVFYCNYIYHIGKKLKIWLISQKRSLVGLTK